MISRALWKPGSHNHTADMLDLRIGIAKVRQMIPCDDTGYFFMVILLLQETCIMKQCCGSKNDQVIAGNILFSSKIFGGGNNSLCMRSIMILEISCEFIFQFRHQVSIYLFVLHIVIWYRH